MPKNNRRTSGLIFWLIGIFIGQLFFSCANEDCVSIFNNNLLVGFIDADTLETGDIVFSDADTIFYSIKAEGNDSIYYDPDSPSSSLITLPVDPAGLNTKFELTMLDSISYDSLNNPTYHVNPNPHIISVSYTRGQRIITEDCGVEIGYSGLKIEEISFNTTMMVDDKLSRLNEVNIEIFF
jgi:hypothetical protein